MELVRPRSPRLPAVTLPRARTYVGLDIISMVEGPVRDSVCRRRALK